MCSLMLFYFVLTIFSFTVRPFVGQQKKRHFFSERFVTLNLTNSSLAQTKLVKPGPLSEAETMLEEIRLYQQQIVSKY